MAAYPAHGRPTAPDGSQLALAAGAGLVTAVVCGIVWALIVKTTDYEIGIAAWGVGFLVGGAVVLAARGRRSTALAAIAVVCALLGVLLGKYMSFVFIARDELSGIVDVPFVSGDTWELFTNNKDLVFSWRDALWIGLAAFTAFRAARPRVEPDPAPEPDRPPENDTTLR